MMDVVTTIEELDRKLQECAEALNGPGGSDDALRAVFGTFRMDFSAGQPPDPFSDAYRDFQLDLYEKVAGKSYRVQNEATVFDPGRWKRPFPYYTESTTTAGNYLGAVGFLIRNLDLPAGARVLEFGPGWGITTIALAQLGMDVTAIEIEPNFCEVIRARADQNDVAVHVIEGDFFEAERFGQEFDAVLFFECFHHCSDHLRLLRSLRGLVKPGGKVVMGAEPIVPGYPVPWGLRMDGESLWAIRNFGWLELGFDENYFTLACRRTGWSVAKVESGDSPWARVWVLREGTGEDDERAEQEPVPPPQVEPAGPATSAVEEALREQLARIHSSTSWRLTAPLRVLGRALKSRQR